MDPTTLTPDNLERRIKEAERQRDDAHRSFAEVVDAAVAQTNEAYRQRNLAASLACRLAVALGIPAGVRIDPEQPPEWATLIQIDLPAGQVSWHVHQREAAALTGLPIATAPWDGHTPPWDGHTPEDRDARCVEPGDLPMNAADLMRHL